MLYTLAYPKISDMDSEFIEAFRRKHDLPYVEAVRAHFTVVFGVEHIDLDEYKKHVETASKNCPAFRFHCKYAMLGKDDSQEIYHVFLVPDEGYSQISLLHDRLYSGVLSEYLRLDIPYVPHVTIATLNDPESAKRLCVELNHVGISIEGYLDELSIGKYDGQKVENISIIQLLKNQDIQPLAQINTL